MALLAGHSDWLSSAGSLCRNSLRCMSRRPFTCTWKNFRKRCWIGSRSFALLAPSYRFQGMPPQLNKELETSSTMLRHFGGPHLQRLSLLSLLSLCAIVACVSGCAVGPNYARPNINTPTSYRAQSDPEARAPEAKGDAGLGDEEWSRVFQDPELQALIRAALQNNYDVRIAAARVQEARAQLGITRADQFPTLSGGGNI